MGISVQRMWECAWNKFKMKLPNNNKLQLAAEARAIKTRDASYGGRTEVINKYHTCVGRQRIGYGDVTSEYPIVNASDHYAVGFRKYRARRTPDDILHDKFIGLA
jgi:hypothetical protein